ncbi:LysM peptidoglycan-binding domain-containing protein [Nocardia sp. IFM 10818]
MNTWAKGTRRRLVGVGNLLMLLTLLAGVPVALWLLRGNPLPAALPSLDSVKTALLQPDTDASLFLGAVTWAGWLAWAWFALSVAVEVTGLIRGVSVPDIRGLRVSRRMAAGLLGGVVLLAPATAMAQPAVPAPDPIAATAQQRDERITTVDYCVRAGDTLWALSEVFLGDPHRWPEIAAANPGMVAVPEQLGTDTVLRMPTNLLAVGDLYTVQSGDTLSMIAQYLLGDPNRWPEICDEHGNPLATTVIHPGQQVKVPVTAAPVDFRPAPPPAPAEVPVEVPAPAPPEAPSVEVPAAPPGAADLPPLPEGFELAPPVHAPAPTGHPAPAPATTTVPTPTADPALVETAAAPTATPVTDHDSDQGLPARAILGVSAVAASALLGLLAFRRRQQQHRRRRGERIAMPSGPAATAESALHLTADQAALERVDTALRHIAAYCRTHSRPLPRLLGVFLGADTLELALLDSVDLSAPWLAGDDGVWSLPTAASIQAPTTAVSPYPALAHLGTAPETGAAVLINLELLGHLGIHSSDQRTALGALRALALFLATSPIADHLELILVGVGRELADTVDTGRLTYSDDLDSVLARLAPQTSTDAATLAEQGVDSLDAARVTYTDSEMTAPVIVLGATALTEPQRHRLDEILIHRPRIAFAAVSPVEDPAPTWTLHLSPDTATLREGDTAGFTFAPAVLAPDDYHDVLAVFATTAAPATPVAADTVPGAAAAVDTAIDLADRLDDIAATAAADDRPLQIVDAADAAPPATGHIWIHLLGKPTVTPLSGAAPERGRGAVCTELAALLVTHPDGLLYKQVDALMWPHSTGKTPDEAAERRQTAFRRLRKWLGYLEDGTELAFPKHGDRSGTARYRLHPQVLSDWAVFCSLLPDGPAAAPTPYLSAAVDQVTGQPFGHTPPQRYEWAEALQQDMISAVSDAIEELAARHIQNGDLNAAAAVTEKGLLVDGAREGIWRLAIVAAHHRDPERAASLVEEMIRYFEDLDIDTFEPQTDELLRHLAQYRDPAGQAPYRVGLAS